MVLAYRRPYAGLLSLFLWIIFGVAMDGTILGF